MPLRNLLPEKVEFEIKRESAATRTKVRSARIKSFRKPTLPAYEIIFQRLFLSSLSPGNYFRRVQSLIGEIA